MKIQFLIFLGQQKQAIETENNKKDKSTIK